MVDASTLFDLMAATHRRRLLLLLCETDSVRVPEGLSTRGQAHRDCSTGGSHSVLRDQSTEDLDIQLLHCHLPKLEATGVIEWDRDRGIASRGPSFGAIEPALRLLADHPDSFPGGLC